MSTNITLRLEKGAALTYAEMDDNFKEIERLARGNIDIVTAGGTANALTITSQNLAVGVMEAGLTFAFIASADNTGATTLDVDGTGVFDILRSDGTGLQAGDLVLGNSYVVMFNGAAFQIMSGTSAPFVNAVLPNDVYLQGKETGGTARELIGVTGANVIKVGDVNNVLETNSSSVPLANYGGTTYEYITSEGNQTIDGSVTVDSLNIVGDDFTTFKISRPGATLVEMSMDNATGGAYMALNATGQWVLSQRASGGAFEDNWLICDRNGGVNLHYDGTKKLETTSTGVTVIGDVTATGGVNLDGNIIGLRSDSNAYVIQTGNTEGQAWYVTDEDNWEMQGRSAAGAFEQVWIRGQGTGQVSLFHNNVQKLQTSTEGVTVTGNVSATGSFDVTVSGAGLNVKAGNVPSLMDFDFPEVTTQTIQTRFFRDTNTSGSKEFVVYKGDGTSGRAFSVNTGAATTLYYNGSTKLETGPNGILVTGNVAATGQLYTSSNSGTQMRVDATSSDARWLGTTNGGGASVVQKSDGRFKIEQFSSGGAFEGTWLEANRNGNVELYFNSSKKFETTNTGVAVTGALTATGDITGNTSDIRTKTNVEDISPEECYEAIKGKRVIRYKNNDINPDADTESGQIGLVANEWEQDYPELTPLAPFDRDEEGNSKSGENYLTQKYERTLAIVLGALQKAQQEIEELKDDVASLRANQPE